MKSTVLTTKPGVEGSVGLQSRLSELDLALGQAQEEREAAGVHLP
jgi:hypothetical protein